MSSLGDLPVVWLDAQATAANPASGALVELGWASGTAAAPPAGHEVSSCLVAPPPGAVMPAAVARLTGIDRGAWQRGLAPETAWRLLRESAERVASPPVPLVVHFARFEEPFLRALHGRHGSGSFPFSLVCTHAIARRLLPGLPRRTLRALAGYFGAAVPAPRRSADHVAATAVVWRHLVDALDGDGIGDLAALREWLARAPARPRRAERAYPLSREQRRALPAGPGVYRLLREGGAVVYVGKATSLRQRVSGHYHSPTGERALELLSQVRDVSCTETPTALEAALLEADEIKRLAPPYNRALTAAERRVWHASLDLVELREIPDEAHPIGPLASPRPFEALGALRVALATGRPASLASRARAVGVEPAYAPDAERFAAGLALFRAAHGPLRTPRDVLRVGGRLWANRRTCASAAPEAVEEHTPPAPGARSRWDAGQVRAALEEAVLRSAHGVRRARWLLRLSECTLEWKEAAPGGPPRRLRIERAVVAARCDAPAGTALAAPGGAGRAPAERRAAFDLAAFDRLRVLTTELRTLVADAPSLELRLGVHQRLSRRRLQAVLRWI